MSESAVARASVSDEQLLLDALQGSPGAWSKLTARLARFLSAIARRRLPDLPPDVHEEFRQEVWMRVAARAPEDFDPRSESAAEFVGHFISAAINSVRASYCPPGHRTRDRGPGPDLLPLADIGLLRDDRAAAAFEAAAARVDLERLLWLAEPCLRQGLELMRDEGLGPTAAARRIGMARETCRRRIREIPSLLRCSP